MSWSTLWGVEFSVRNRIMKVLPFFLWSSLDALSCSTPCHDHLHKEEVVFTPVLDTWGAAPQILCSVFGSSWQERKMQEHVQKHLKGGSKVKVRLFFKVTSDRTGENDIKLDQARFRLGIRKTFFGVRAVSNRNRLLREVAESPSLEVWKSMWMWHEGTWFSGEHGSAGLVVALNDLRGLFPL